MGSGNEVAVKNDPEDESNKEPIEESLSENEPSDPPKNTESESSEINEENTVPEPEQSEDVVEDVESEEVVSSEAPPAEAEAGEVEEELVPAQEEEEEDEEDLIDPLEEIREECKTIPDAVAFKTILDECNDRVNSRSNTEEKCHEEMIDYMHAVDHCMSKSLFGKLK